ncbi:glycosyltransferase family 4 protein [Monashia sp. NPDC004114]
MRVVHAIRSDAFGGVENYVARLSRAQAETGDEVTVIGGDPMRMRNVLGPGAAQVVPATSVAAVWLAVRDHLGAADVVHAHMTAAELACSVAMIGSRVPLVCTRHFAQRRGRHALVHLGSSLVARHIAAQISVSRFVADSVEGESVMIYPGVPPEPAAPDWASREPVVLVAQRLEDEKHTDEAIRAFAISGLGAEGWRMEVAGDGACRGSLQRLAQQLGTGDSVRFLGQRSDVGQLMRTSRILVASSPSEHFGLSVIESMASGLPVVATASGGHLETLGTVEGARLYPAGDVDAAAKAIRRLAESPESWATYSRSLREAQQRHFTLDQQLEATRRVYEAVL